MQRRQFLAALPLCGAPWVHAQGKSLTPLKFTLDFRVNSQTAPFFLAQQNGYYRDEGLDVSLDVGSGSVASITRIASGAYQLGLGDISSLIEFNAQNAGTPACRPSTSTTTARPL
jgi:ABC-type nitrate/sulfonate/bicarbonate transport system substrate-binding protein